MGKQARVMLLLAAISCSGDASEDDCSAVRFVYSCFDEDVYVTVCARCEPAPNTPGAKTRRMCSMLWANMSCVAEVDGHRWAGSSTKRLDCVVDGGTGKSVHYSFDLGSDPATAYMTTVTGGESGDMVSEECRDIDSE